MSFLFRGRNALNTLLRFGALEPVLVCNERPIPCTEFGAPAAQVLMKDGWHFTNVVPTNSTDINNAVIIIYLFS